MGIRHMQATQATCVRACLRCNERCGCLLFWQTPTTDMLILATLNMNIEN